MNELFKILTPDEKQLCEAIANDQDSLSNHDQLFDKLYDHYLNNGQMPYSVQKCRDQDPLSWISNEIDKTFQQYQ